jgi:hypothetical protein
MKPLERRLSSSHLEAVFSESSDGLRTTVFPAAKGLKASPIEKLKGETIRTESVIVLFCLFWSHPLVEIRQE